MASFPQASPPTPCIRTNYEIQIRHLIVSKFGTVSLLIILRLLTNININVNGIPHKLTILHCMYQTFFLIFIGPCVVLYSCSTTKKMHLLSQIIYSFKTFYIFRTVFPSIIRSSKLRIQQRYMSNSCCYLLLPGMR